MTIDVTSVNDIPTSADKTVTATEDTVYTFTPADFAFTDVGIESQTLTTVRLQAATTGTLWVDVDGDGTVNGAEAAVANNDLVAFADLGNLKFLGDMHDFGAASSTFAFEVNDGDHRRQLHHDHRHHRGERPADCCRQHR